MAQDGTDRAVSSPVRPERRRRRIRLRLRVTCSEPQPQAGAAWTEFLLRMIRQRRRQEVQPPAGTGPHR